MPSASPLRLCLPDLDAILNAKPPGSAGAALGVMNTTIATVNASAPSTVRLAASTAQQSRRLSSYEITAMIGEILAIEANPGAWRRQQSAAVAS